MLVPSVNVDYDLVTLKTEYCIRQCLGAPAASQTTKLHMKINVKKIALRNKENTTDKKLGVSAPRRLFISSNEVRNTAHAL